MCRKLLDCDQEGWSDPVLVSHRVSLVTCLTRGLTNTCPDLELATRVTSVAQLVVKEAQELVETPGMSQYFAKIIILEYFCT